MVGNKTKIALVVGALAGMAAMNADAVTLTPLATPVNVPHGYPYTTQCIATKFAAEDSSSGMCDASVGNSGRYAPRTNYVYSTTWDVDGNALSSTYCGTFKSPVWTYAAGFSANTCYLPNPGQDQVSLYDPALGYDAWFFYQSASSDGAYELVSLGLYGYIYGL